MASPHSVGSCSSRTQKKVRCFHQLGKVQQIREKADGRREGKIIQRQIRLEKVNLGFLFSHMDFCAHRYAQSHKEGHLNHHFSAIKTVSTTPLFRFSLQEKKIVLVIRVPGKA